MVSSTNTVDTDPWLVVRWRKAGSSQPGEVTSSSASLSPVGPGDEDDERKTANAMTMTNATDKTMGIHALGDGSGIRFFVKVASVPIVIESVNAVAVGAAVIFTGVCFASTVVGEIVFSCPALGGHVDWLEDGTKVPVAVVGDFVWVATVGEAEGALAMPMLGMAVGAA